MPPWIGCTGSRPRLKSANQTVDANLGSAEDERLLVAEFVSEDFFDPGEFVLCRDLVIDLFDGVCRFRFRPNADMQRDRAGIFRSCA